MITVERARKVMDGFKGKRVLVVGDLMLDRYVHGVVHRISPEAPVPVVLSTHERFSAGGAANVALNIQSLGGQAVVAGVVGKDKDADDLMAVLSRRGIHTDGVLADGKIRTIVKTRIMAERQQVVRVDREDPPERLDGILAAFSRLLLEQAARVDGVVVEDYGKGVICQQTVDALQRATREEGIAVGLDPKENHELEIAGITLATPNYREAMLAAGFADKPLLGAPETDSRLKEAGGILMKKWHPQLLLITLGAHGMYLLSRDDAPRIIPAKAREVFDVCGAGDTVIAATMLAHLAGASPYEAASIANYAAGVVVGKVGTATCSPDELLGSIE